MTVPRMLTKEELVLAHRVVKMLQPLAVATEKLQLGNSPAIACAEIGLGFGMVAFNKQPLKFPATLPDADAIERECGGEDDDPVEVYDASASVIAGLPAHLLLDGEVKKIDIVTLDCEK